jgi:4'-phosphopantetheinyl transferase
MDLRFNLSHTQGAALIGVAAGRELGIDIERLRPMEDLEAMARSVMSHEELEQWTTIHPADQELAFYRLWTRKEAYLKAIGLGLFRNLQDVTVPVVPQFLEPDRVHWVQDRAGEGRWQLRDIAVGAGYAGAICCEGAEPVRLVVRDMDPLVMEYAVPEEE